jgi:hypothetical protein
MHNMAIINTPVKLDEYFCCIWYYHYQALICSDRYSVAFSALVTRHVQTSDNVQYTSTGSVRQLFDNQ